LHNNILKILKNHNEEIVINNTDNLTDNEDNIERQELRMFCYRQITKKKKNKEKWFH